MDEIILTSVLYLIIICFLGHLIINYCFKETVREGARTLPRPVIHPEINQPNYKFKPSPPYYGETLDAMIDRYINMYFDNRGIPYTNTMAAYKNICIGDGDGKGNVTEINKSKLNDIGYYILNIVIPNIQSVKNPNPEQYWPPIKWSGMNGFSTTMRPTPTYLVYKGQEFKGDYSSQYDSSLSNDRYSSGPEGGSGSQNAGTSGTSGSSDGSSDSGGCGKGNMNDCGIGCPSSCLAGIMSKWSEEDNKNKSGEGGTGGTTDYGTYTDGSQWNDPNYYGTGNVKNMPNSSNTVIIGSAKIDGYAITDIDQKNNVNTLNDEIEAFIKDFFIEKGPNKNKPTQKAIDMYNMYFQYKKPMNDIHMNKMRDVIYYILQVLIPGLPTSDRPKCYVEWRPIVWLSLSERFKK